MPAQGSKFYYYEMYGKNSDRQQVTLGTILASRDLNDPTQVISREASGRHYMVKIVDLGAGFFTGQILRSKRSEDFFNRRGHEIKNLAELVPANSETGENIRDIVHFGIGPYGEGIIVLMQAGLQYPGMGVLEDYFNGLFSEQVKFWHQLLKTPKVENSLARIWGKNLKELVLQPKKNVQLPRTWVVEDFIRRLGLPPAFEFCLEVKVRKGRTARTRSPLVAIKDCFNHIFSLGGTGREAMVGLLQQDLPGLFSSFEVVVWDTDYSTHPREDLLDSLEKEVVQLSAAFFTDADLRRIGGGLMACIQEKSRQLRVSAGGN